MNLFQLGNKEGSIMPLIQLLEVLVVVGVLLWLVNRFIPMQEMIKSILNGVVVIAVVLWILSVFGLLSLSFPDTDWKLKDDRFHGSGRAHFSWHDTVNITPLVTSNPAMPWTRGYWASVETSDYLRFCLGIEMTKIGLLIIPHFTSR